MSSSASASASASSSSKPSSRNHHHHRTHSRRSSDPSEPVFQEDGPLVGTPDILSSPNVIEPDVNIRGLKNKPIPTPSIYRDPRGQIINLLVGDSKEDYKTRKRENGTTSSLTTTATSQGTKEEEPPPKQYPGKRINILRTVKGAMRSGDLHPNKQCSFVFEGTVEVWIPQKDGSTRKFTLGPRDYFEVPPFVPHVENFLDDTIHAEWWEPTTRMGHDSSGQAGFQHWLYAPYRRLVDLSFEWGHGDKPRGTLMLLREGKLIEDPVLEDNDIGDKNNSSRSKTIDRLTLLLGCLAVGSFGYVLGKMQRK